MSNPPKPKDPRTTIWLFGLPCAGKTTIAIELKRKLESRGTKTVHLDADDIRGKLNADLGFSDKDRVENLRRAAHVARLINDNSICVIASFVSPTHQMRRMVKGIIKQMTLVYVKCDVKICEKRDVKGMYKKARQGMIKNFTGISAPFDVPRNADVIVDTSQHGLEYCVDQILDKVF